MDKKYCLIMDEIQDALEKSSNILNPVYDKLYQRIEDFFLNIKHRVNQKFKIDIQTFKIDFEELEEEPEIEYINFVFINDTENIPRLKCMEYQLYNNEFEDSSTRLYFRPCYYMIQAFNTLFSTNILRIRTSNKSMPLIIYNVNLDTVEREDYHINYVI